MLIIGITGGLVLTLLVVHDEGAGADADAYWQAVRTWLAGGNPYVPAGSSLPYVYPIWLLPLFVPWALLPWEVAWFVWRAAMIVLLAWTFTWAYRRRPLGTAGACLALSIPVGLVLDSGNVSAFLAFGLWAAQLSGPRAGALLWALATALKWIPVVFFPLLSPAGRRWGAALAAIAVVLTLATWPWTLEQLRAMSISGFPSLEAGVHSLRVDHLVFLWAAIPWLWGVRPQDGRRKGAG